MADQFAPVWKNSKIHPISNDYEITDLLGSGTYSQVYKGTHHKTKEAVAIKIMNKIEFSDDLDALVVEIQIMDKVKDIENVVRLLDVYETSENLLLVLDLVTGGELFEKIAMKGIFSEKDAVHTIKQLLVALSKIHKLRIVHRDLKPENLLCSSKSVDQLDDIKIADFGEGIELVPGQFTTDLRGSPCYIAPEVWKEEEYDMCSDMWSLGVIAYILLGGYLPFEPPQFENEDEVDDLAVAQVIIKGEFKFHDDAWADINEDAKDFIRKLLTVDKNKRLTAEKALQHPWINNESGASTKTREKAISNLKSFNAKRKWRSLAQMVIATNKMKNLCGYKRRTNRHKSIKTKKSSTVKKTDSSTPTKSSSKRSNPSDSPKSSQSEVSKTNSHRSSRKKSK